MEKVWRYVPKTKGKFLISNYGEVYSLKTFKFLKTFKQGLRNYITIDNNVHSLGRLVLKVFGKLNNYTYLVKDYDFDNLKKNNLKNCSRGDALRFANTIKNKQRGIYKFKVKMKNGNYYERYRVVIKHENKPKTYLYTEDKDYAEMFYIEKFKELFGHYPVMN